MGDGDGGVKDRKMVVLGDMGTVVLGTWGQWCMGDGDKGYRDSCRLVSHQQWETEENRALSASLHSWS